MPEMNNNPRNRRPAPPHNRNAKGYAPVHGVRGTKNAMQKKAQPRRKAGPARAPKEMPPIPAMPFLPKIENEEENRIPTPKHGTTISNKVELAPKEFDQASEFVEAEKGLKNIARSARIATDTIILLVIAVALQFLRIKFDFLPSFLEVDFSIVPEFIGLVFYGPVVGVAMVILKNIAHMLIFFLMHGTINYVSDLSNFLTDSCFIVTAFIVFRFVLGITHSHRLPRAIRIRGLFFSGLIGAGATAVIMLPVTRYIIYPMFVDFFEAHGVQLNIFAYYVEKLPTVKSMLHGMLIFNLPWDFCKLLGVTIFATLIYALVTLKEKKHNKKEKNATK